MESLFSVVSQENKGSQIDVLAEIDPFEHALIGISANAWCALQEKGIWTNKIRSVVLANGNAERSRLTP